MSAIARERMSFLFPAIRFLTVWYLLSAHVERLLMLYGQPNGKRWCSVFRTKCIILTVFVLSLVAFLHYIWSHVVVWKRGQYICTTMQESVIHLNRLRRVELSSTAGTQFKYVDIPGHGRRQHDVMAAMLGE
ncbi:hypothetical protein ACOMHN_060594 [Nucella lapillus]